MTSNSNWDCLSKALKKMIKRKYSRQPSFCDYLGAKKARASSGLGDWTRKPKKQPSGWSSSMRKLLTTWVRRTSAAGDCCSVHGSNWSQERLEVQGQAWWLSRVPWIWMGNSTRLWRKFRKLMRAASVKSSSQSSAKADLDEELDDLAIPPKVNCKN